MVEDKTTALPMTKGCLTFSVVDVVGCSTTEIIESLFCKWNPEKWTPDEASIKSSTAFEPILGILCKSKQIRCGKEEERLNNTESLLQYVIDQQILSHKH